MSSDTSSPSSSDEEEDLKSHASPSPNEPTSSHLSRNVENQLPFQRSPASTSHGFSQSGKGLRGLAEEIQRKSSNIKSCQDCSTSHKKISELEKLVEQQNAQLQQYQNEIAMKDERYQQLQQRNHELKERNNKMCLLISDFHRSFSATVSDMSTTSSESMPPPPAVSSNQPSSSGWKSHSSSSSQPTDSSSSASQPADSTFSPLSPYKPSYSLSNYKSRAARRLGTASPNNIAKSTRDTAVARVNSLSMPVRDVADLSSSPSGNEMRVTDGSQVFSQYQTTAEAPTQKDDCRVVTEENGGQENTNLQTNAVVKNSRKRTRQSSGKSNKESGEPKSKKRRVPLLTVPIEARASEEAHPAFRGDRPAVVPVQTTGSNTEDSSQSSMTGFNTSQDSCCHADNSSCNKLDQNQLKLVGLAKLSEDKTGIDPLKRDPSIPDSRAASHNDSTILITEDRVFRIAPPTLYTERLPYEATPGDSTAQSTSTQKKKSKKKERKSSSAPTEHVDTDTEEAFTKSTAETGSNCKKTKGKRKTVRKNSCTIQEGVSIDIITPMEIVTAENKSELPPSDAKRKKEPKDCSDKKKNNNKKKIKVDKEPSKTEEVNEMSNKKELTSEDDDVPLKKFVKPNKKTSACDNTGKKDNKSKQDDRIKCDEGEGLTTNRNSSYCGSSISEEKAKKETPQRRKPNSTKPLLNKEKTPSQSSAKSVPQEKKNSKLMKGSNDGFSDSEEGSENKQDSTEGSQRLRRRTSILLDNDNDDICSPIRRSSRLRSKNIECNKKQEELKDRIRRRSLPELPSSSSSSSSEEEEALCKVVILKEDAKNASENWEEPCKVAVVQESEEFLSSLAEKDKAIAKEAKEKRNLAKNAKKQAKKDLADNKQKSESVSSETDKEKDQMSGKTVTEELPKSKTVMEEECTKTKTKLSKKKRKLAAKHTNLFSGNELKSSEKEKEVIEVPELQEKEKSSEIKEKSSEQSLKGDSKVDENREKENDVMKVMSPSVNNESASKEKKLSTNDSQLEKKAKTTKKERSSKKKKILEKERVEVANLLAQNEEVDKIENDLAEEKKTMDKENRTNNVDPMKESQSADSNALNVQKRFEMAKESKELVSNPVCQANRESAENVEDVDIQKHMMTDSEPKTANAWKGKIVTKTNTAPPRRVPLSATATKKRYMTDEEKLLAQKVSTQRHLDSQAIANRDARKVRDRLIKEKGEVILLPEEDPPPKPWQLYDKEEDEETQEKKPESMSVFEERAIMRSAGHQDLKAKILSEKRQKLLQHVREEKGMMENKVAEQNMDLSQDVKMDEAGKPVPKEIFMNKLNLSPRKATREKSQIYGSYTTSKSSNKITMEGLSFAQAEATAKPQAHQSQATLEPSSAVRDIMSLFSSGYAQPSPVSNIMQLAKINTPEKPQEVQNASANKCTSSNEANLSISRPPKVASDQVTTPALALIKISEDKSVVKSQKKLLPNDPRRKASLDSLKPPGKQAAMENVETMETRSDGRGALKQTLLPKIEKLREKPLPSAQDLFSAPSKNPCAPSPVESLASNSPLWVIDTDSDKESRLQRFQSRENIDPAETKINKHTQERPVKVSEMKDKVNNDVGVPIVQEKGAEMQDELWDSAVAGEVEMLQDDEASSNMYDIVSEIPVNILGDKEVREDIEEWRVSELDGEKSSMGSSRERPLTKKQGREEDTRSKSTSLNPLKRKEHQDKNLSDRDRNENKRTDRRSDHRERSRSRRRGSEQYRDRSREGKSRDSRDCYDIGEGGKERQGSKRDDQDQSPRRQSNRRDKQNFDRNLSQAGSSKENSKDDTCQDTEETSRDQRSERGSERRIENESTREVSDKRSEQVTHRSEAGDVRSSVDIESRQTESTSRDSGPALSAKDKKKQREDSTEKEKSKEICDLEQMVCGDGYREMASQEAQGKQELGKARDNETMAATGEITETGQVDDVEMNDKESVDEKPEKSNFQEFVTESHTTETASIDSSNQKSISYDINTKTEDKQEMENIQKSGGEREISSLSNKEVKNSQTTTKEVDSSVVNSDGISETNQSQNILEKAIGQTGSSLRSDQVDSSKKSKDENSGSVVSNKEEESSSDSDSSSSDESESNSVAAKDNENDSSDSDSDSDSSDSDSDSDSDSKENKDGNKSSSSSSSSSSSDSGSDDDSGSSSDSSGDSDNSGSSSSSSSDSSSDEDGEGENDTALQTQQVEVMSQDKVCVVNVGTQQKEETHKATERVVKTMSPAKADRNPAPDTPKQGASKNNTTLAHVKLTPNKFLTPITSPFKATSEKYKSPLKNFKALLNPQNLEGTQYSPGKIARMQNVGEMDDSNASSVEDQKSQVKVVHCERRGNLLVESPTKKNPNMAVTKNRGIDERDSGDAEVKSIMDNGEGDREINSNSADDSDDSSSDEADKTQTISNYELFGSSSSDESEDEEKQEEFVVEDEETEEGELKNDTVEEEFDFSGVKSYEDSRFSFNGESEIKAGTEKISEMAARDQCEKKPHRRRSSGNEQSDRKNARKVGNRARHVGTSSKAIKSPENRRNLSQVRGQSDSDLRRSLDIREQRNKQDANRQNFGRRQSENDTRLKDRRGRKRKGSRNHNRPNSKRRR